MSNIYYSMRRGFLLILCCLSVFSISAVTQPLAGTTDSPQGFGSWQVIGPSGGDVRVVTYDPRDKDRLYISTLDGQIHTSEDGGRSWRLLVNLNAPGLVLDQLFVDSQDSRLIYTSGHRGTAPGGFFKSSDKGLTWKEAKELNSESIYSMTQSTADPNVLLVGASTGIWISKNKGDSWDKISSATMPTNVNSLAIDPRNTSTFYAGTQYRPFKSTDAGKSWGLMNEGMIDDSDVFAITIDPKNPEHIISSACSGIYESFNAGEKWAKIQGIPSQSRRTRDLLQHTSIPGTYYAATTEGFWMTSNAGKSWALTTQRNLEINSIAVHPDTPNKVFIATNTYGLMVSEDGGANFTSANANFSSRFTYSVVPDIQEPDRLYATNLNIGTGGGFFFASSDGGKTWLPARNLDPQRVRPFVVKQDASAPNILYLGTSMGIFLSTDRGGSWSPLVAAKPSNAVSKTPTRKAAVAAKKRAGKKVVSTVVQSSSEVPILIPSLNATTVRTIHILDNGKGLIAGTDHGLYRSTDLKKGWKKIPLVGLNEDIFALHIAPSRPFTIWVGTATSGVIVSHDNGMTWARTGGAVDNVPVSSITSDPKRPDYLYVGTTQTFYLSRDGGNTWVRRGGLLPLGNFNSILINPENTDEILISSSFETDGGIYISSNAGNQWKRIDTPEMRLPTRRVWSIAFDPKDPNRIFAGTHSSGVYKIERVPPTKMGM